MSLKIALTIRQEMINRVKLATDAGATLVGYTGAPPASPEAAATGTLLFTADLGTTPFQVVGDYIRSGAGPYLAPVTDNGVMGYFRILDAGGDCVLQSTFDPWLTVTGVVGDSVEVSDTHGLEVHTPVRLVTAGVELVRGFVGLETATSFEVLDAPGGTPIPTHGSWVGANVLTLAAGTFDTPGGSVSPGDVLAFTSPIALRIF